jgi:RNA polymerase sigma-70 factor, ECF subfamily
LETGEQLVARGAGKASAERTLPAADSALADAILAGDRKATAEFISRFADRVYAYVSSRLLPRTDLAEDLAQEVFLAAWQNLASFGGKSSLEAWLLGIARHKVEDHYRARLRAMASIEEVFEDAPEPALALDVEGKLDQDRLRERTLRVLADLPEHYRLALLWRYWEKCPAQEIAARTGKTEKAVERLLDRARHQFRRIWQDA